MGGGFNIQLNAVHTSCEKWHLAEYTSGLIGSAGLLTMFFAYMTSIGSLISDERFKRASCILMIGVFFGAGAGTYGLLLLFSKTCPLGFLHILICSIQASCIVCVFPCFCILWCIAPAS